MLCFVWSKKIAKKTFPHLIISSPPTWGNLLITIIQLKTITPNEFSEQQNLFCYILFRCKSFFLQKRLLQSSLHLPLGKTSDHSPRDYFTSFLPNHSPPLVIHFGHYSLSFFSILHLSFQMQLFASFVEQSSPHGTKCLSKESYILYNIFQL